MKVMMTKATTVHPAQRRSDNNQTLDQGYFCGRCTGHPKEGYGGMVSPLLCKSISSKGNENVGPHTAVMKYPWICETKPPPTSATKPLAPLNKMPDDTVPRDLLEGEDEWMTRRAFKYLKYEPSGIYDPETRGNRYCRSGRMVGEVENFPHTTFRSKMSMKIIDEGVFGARCKANDGPYSGGVFRPAHKSRSHWHKKRFPLAFLGGSQMNYEASV